MYNFDFYNPTHIVFGKDRLDELDTLVPKDAKVLITYGGGSAMHSGLIDRIVKLLVTARLSSLVVLSQTHLLKLVNVR